MSPHQNQRREPVPWRETLSTVWQIAALCAVLCFLIEVPLAIHSAKMPLGGDMLVYKSLATSIQSGHGFSIDGKPSADKSPGYPYMVALIWAVFGAKLLPLFLIQAFLASVKCAAVSLLAYRVTGKKPVALLAGLAVVAYLPINIWYTQLLGEILFDTVALATLLSFDLAIRSRKVSAYALAGALVGLTIYCRPNGVLFLMILLGMALYSCMGIRRAVLATVLAGVVASIVVLPWSIRNERAFGVFTPLPAQKGLVLWGSWKWDDIRTRRADFVQETNKLVGYKSGYEADDILWRQGVSDIKSSPGEYVTSVFYKTGRQWFNLFWQDQKPSRATTVLAVVNALLLLFAVPGLWRRRIDPMFRAYTLACVIYITAAGALFSTAEVRYGFWAYPLLFILASDTVYGLWSSKVAHRRVEQS